MDRADRGPPSALHDPEYLFAPACPHLHCRVQHPAGLPPPPGPLRGRGAADRAGGAVRRQQHHWRGQVLGHLPDRSMRQRGSGPGRGVRSGGGQRQPRRLHYALQEGPLRGRLPENPGHLALRGVRRRQQHQRRRLQPPVHPPRPADHHRRHPRRQGSGRRRGPGRPLRRGAGHGLGRHLHLHAGQVGLHCPPHACRHRRGGNHRRLTG